MHPINKAGLLCFMAAGLWASGPVATQDMGLTDDLLTGPAVSNARAVDSTIAFPYSETTALDFIDDFSRPTSLLSFDPSLDSTDAGIALINGALEIEAVQTDPNNCCGDGRLRIQEKTDFVAARVSLSGDTLLPAEGDTVARIRIEGNWYNDTQDGGFGDRGGDVFAQLRIRLRGDGRRLAEFCFFRQTGDGSGEELNIVDGDTCGSFDTIPELDTEYDISISIDRVAATMTFTFNDETQVVNLGGTVFEVARSERAINVQHEGSSGRATGRLHSLSTDSSTIDFATDAALIGPYRPHFSTQFAGREVVVVDGRLRIEVDSAFTEDNQPQFVSENPSEYVSAVLEISSESRLDSGLVNMDVGATMYNDLADGGLGDSTNSEGAVYGITRMVLNNEGQDYYIEYCAIRSNNNDFSDTTELLGDDGQTCPRFTTTPSLDTPVRLTVAIDRSRGVLIFSAGEETVEHTITTQVFTPHNYFNGVRVEAKGGSRLVGFADDLAYSENPVALADSITRVGFAAGLSDGSSVGAGSDIGSDIGSGDDSGGGGGGGGGGCSIANGRGGMGAPLLMFMAMLILRLRRCARARITRRQESRRLA